MKQKWSRVFALALVLQLVHVPQAAPLISNFVAKNGASTIFYGDSNDHLIATDTSTPTLDMGNRNFTISWWQRTTSPQNKFPRILQFGDGHAYTDLFAISEEQDGRIYLWIGGENITSIHNPNDDAWHHIAITRESNDYSWFIDGEYITTTSSTDTVTATATTSGLPLLIGSGNDSITGGFTGYLAGLQIKLSLRWERENFTPPTNFLNPVNGLAFSMYVSETNFTDKSGNFSAITPVNLSTSSISDFIPPPRTEIHKVTAKVFYGKGGVITAQTESWTAGASIEETQTSFLVYETETFRVDIRPKFGYRVKSVQIDGVSYTDPEIWHNSGMYITGSDLSENQNILIFFELFKLRSVVESDEGGNVIRFNEMFTFLAEETATANDYWGVGANGAVIMALPIYQPNPGSEPIRKTCYINMADSLEISSSGSRLRVYMTDFAGFLEDYFPDNCVGAPIPGSSDRESFPPYEVGLFGSDTTTVSFSIFGQFPTDITDTSTALETHNLTIKLPPEITSFEITRFDPSKSSAGYIYFGDTLTVSAQNLVNATAVELAFVIPEARSTNPAMFEPVCVISTSPTFGPAFPIFSEEDLLTFCRMDFDDVWEFDRDIDHAFYFSYFDTAGNQDVIPLLLASPNRVEPTPPAPTPPAPTPPAPTPPAPVPPTPPAPVVDVKVESTETHLTESVKAEPEKAEPTKPEPVKVEPTKTEKPQTISIKAKACTAQGIWIFTKSGLLQICDEQLKVVLATKACTGKSATPTFPWVFKAQRFKPGYTNTKSGLQIYYSVFFYKGLAIAGIDHVSNAPCSNGSVFIDKKSAKKVYEFLKATSVPIWVKNR
ncbi:LamG domain containing protein [Candidatus Nanopelagicaceae bacterium]